MIKSIMQGTMVAAALAVSQLVAAPVALSHQCSAGEAINGISVSDVTGNAGGATDCFGTFNGNLSGPGITLTHDGREWQFISKIEEEGIEGANIGLYVDGFDTSGIWGFSEGLNFESFIVVLKAAANPGWAAWLFDGDDAASYHGSYDVAWNRDLSHLSVYAIVGSVSVPEPGSLALLGFALVGLGFAARRRQQ